MRPDSNNSASNEHLLRGVVQRITFRNADNGYTVLQISVPDERERITVVGICGDLGVGTTVSVRGEYIEHPKFGKQLAAQSITTTAPETVEGLIKYLGSGVVKGIGEKTAARIVKEFGPQTMEIIHRSPDKIAAVPGVGATKAKLIAEQFAVQGELQEILKFLLEHNVSQNLAMKIFERYGSRSVELISKDPYLLARTGGLKGVGFVTADSIAMNLGIVREAPQRIRAGLFYALEKAADDGHCFLKWPELVRRAGELLELTEEIDLEPHLEKLCEEGAVVRDGDAIYLKHLARAEEFVASFIAARMNPFPEPILDSETVESALNDAERDLGVAFSQEQRYAVDTATRYPLMLITGGPGCGKTTIIRALSLLFRRAGKRLALTAPTGRAAQRMAQVCGISASTIHRLLKYDPSNGHFVHGINEPLDIDALIVDESSMIDIQLARDLFSAVPAHAPIILVGDKDQLPSVGPGRMFGDLLSIVDIKSVALTQLFRRQEESSITTVAYQINAGITPQIPEPDGQTKSDAYFISREDPESICSLLEKLVSEQIPKRFGINTEEILVITPSNRGPLGAIALNERLQNKLNPETDSEQQFEHHGSLFRLGDRVCQRVNNYQIDPLGVFNGDTGTVYSVDRLRKTITIDLWDGRLIKYDLSTMGQLSLAYAITVHRSQGSEAPCVVLVLHESQYTLLERQLIYTGVTRAKKLLIVVGSRKALQIACKRTTTAKRGTGLKKRIMEIFGGHEVISVDQ